MSNRNYPWKNWIAVGLLSSLAVPALADRSDAVRYSDELESCVTAIKSELDLAGVNRIRHIVTESKPQGIAYELKLDTSTFAGETEKRYSAYCLVTGKSKPSRPPNPATDCPRSPRPWTSRPGSRAAAARSGSGSIP